jgi:CRISPR-associated endonuclease Csn1
VRKLVKERFAEVGDKNAKKAFAEPLFLDVEKNIPIKSVRCLTGLESLQPLHYNDEGKAYDFVSTRNNHHVAIYEGKDGKRFEKVITFWEALERKMKKLPVVDREPADGSRFLISIQSNEMFVFGLNPEEIDFFNPDNLGLISKHLYRCQKITTLYYVFRHHLETKLDDSKNALEMKRFIRITSLSKLNFIKVKLDTLGRIVKIGD